MMTDEIIIAEKRLYEAMKKSDLKELDLLIADGLIFTAHTGKLFTKQDDMEAHRSGNIQISAIETSDLIIKKTGEIAIVSVLMKIAGSFFGTPETGTFRFTRIWKKTGGEWQIVAGHSTLVA